MVKLCVFISIFKKKNTFKHLLKKIIYYKEIGTHFN